MPMQRQYICEGCGRTFKSQGIGPHQRSTGHEGRRLVRSDARPLTNVIEAEAKPVRQPPVKPRSTPAAVLRLTVMPYIVVQDENGRHGLLQWEETNDA